MENIELNKNENIKWNGKPDIKMLISSFIGMIIVSGFISIIAIIVGIVSKNILLSGIVFISVLILGMLNSYFRVKNTKYVITNKRIIKKYDGFTSKVYDDVSLNKIQNTGWNQGFFQSFFDLGTVEISSAGSSGSDMRFRSIKNPKKTRNIISDSVNKMKSKDDNLEQSSSNIDKKILEELEELNSNLNELTGE